MSDVTCAFSGCKGEPDRGTAWCARHHTCDELLEVGVEHDDAGRVVRIDSESSLFLALLARDLRRAIEARRALLLASRSLHVHAARALEIDDLDCAEEYAAAVVNILARCAAANGVSFRPPGNEREPINRPRLEYLPTFWEGMARAVRSKE